MLPWATFESIADYMTIIPINARKPRRVIKLTILTIGKRSEFPTPAWFDGTCDRRRVFVSRPNIMAAGSTVEYSIFAACYINLLCALLEMRAAREASRQSPRQTPRMPARFDWATVLNLADNGAPRPAQGFLLEL